MTGKEALSVLREIDSKVVRLNHISAILGWDQDTVMPVSAGEERGEQFALLSSIGHRLATSRELQEAVKALDSENLSDIDKALVRYWKKELGVSLSLSSEFIEKLSIAKNKAHYSWMKAREESDFSIYEEDLSSLLELTKERMRLIGKGKSLYDTALDLYEDGLDTSSVDSLFGELEVVIHDLMDKLEDIDVNDSFLYKPYDKNKLHAFCMDLIDRMGFDRKRGAVGITAHPYTTSLGADDHRISTRYSDDGIFDPIGSIVHETGHALYEQCASSIPGIRGTSLAQGVSMGVHESQSRFWENIMGRSKSFWSFNYPRLQEEIEPLKDVSLDDFIKAINKSKPSGIRVNADELTYNLHIILRYRIEKELFDGTISVHDLPARWNELSSSIVRYKVKNDSEGVLQDVHWSQGDFGYFPTYAIGNIYSAAFYASMCKSLGGKDAVDRYLEAGEYSPITRWQAENIWRYGGIYEPNALLERVTGSKIDVEPFKEYLVTKFSSLYLN